MKLIIEIPEEEYTKTLKGEFNVTVFNKAVLNATPIPDNATNGDVIMAILGDIATFDDDWWNAPYQKGGKDEN